MHKLSFNSKHFIPRKLDEIDKYEKVRLQRILSQEIIERDLDLYNNQFIVDLGNIKEVRGDLILSYSSIKSLGKLERVEGELDLSYSQIEDLGNLKYVGRSLWPNSTPIKSLKNLEFVGGWLDLSYLHIEDLGNLKYVGEDLWLYNTPLSKRFKSWEELEQYVRSKVNVEGKIYVQTIIQ
jgi:Leucine-rich repeat (LRR) protein